MDVSAAQTPTKGDTSNTDEDRPVTRRTKKRRVIEDTPPASEEQLHTPDTNDTKRKTRSQTEKETQESSEPEPPTPTRTRSRARTSLSPSKSLLLRRRFYRHSVEIESSNTISNIISNVVVATPAKKSSQTSPTKSSSIAAPSVLFTGISDEKREKIVKHLGGTIASSVQTCTHVVTDHVHRTVKFLSAMCLPAKIVNVSWLEKSDKAKHFLEGKNVSKHN
jgi:hypothetical protein